MTLLHEERLFPADAEVRGIARRLYAEVAEAPILSPHGHTQAAWFATGRGLSKPCPSC